MKNDLAIPTKHKPPDFNNPLYIEKFGKCKKAWKWYDKDGNWIYCTVVYINVEKKIYKQFIYKNNEWIMEDLKNNVLYNLPEIIKNNKDIVLLDNEMSIDILNSTNKEDFIFTTWTGDVSQIANTNFSYLENKKTYYMASSWAISKQVIYFLREKLSNLIVVDPPVDRHGWNIADDFKIMQLNRQEVKCYITNLQLTEKEKKELEIKESRNYLDNIQFPFGILGYNGNRLYFISNETGQLQIITRGGINQTHLLNLAPLAWWEAIFIDESKKIRIIDWPRAVDELIRQCNARKPFSLDCLRGRGAWIDNDKLLIHTGENIFYNSQIIHVRDFKNNKYIYERLPEKKINFDCDILSEEKRLKLWKCLQKLSIQNKIELYYLIGWCILAPFGGALRWKPHIWLTGPSGTGKSSIIEYIILCFCGNFREYATGETTAAGIRQSSPTDSLPIIFDEAEPDEEGVNRIKHVLSLARSITTQENNAMVLKGSASHDAVKFINNSMFCLSSVHEWLVKEADKSRFSVIRMTRNLLFPWKTFSLEIMNCFTKKTGDEIRKRTFLNFGKLLNNIKSFTIAAGQLLGKQRQGDQVGTLLAGAMFFLNGKEYNYDEAYEMCKKILKDFENFNENDMSDEINCLMKIFTSRIKWINSIEKIEETTLLNLTHKAFGENEYCQPDKSAAEELLKYGIKCDIKNQIVYIRSNYEWIKNILKNTEWQNNYSVVIRNLEFVEKNTKPVRFGAYGHGRAIIIKSDYILRLSDDNIYMESGID